MHGLVLSESRLFAAQPGIFSAVKTPMAQICSPHSPASDRQTCVDYLRLSSALWGWPSMQSLSKVSTAAFSPIAQILTCYLDVTRASSTKTTATAPVITSLSSTAGPFLAAYSYTWSQYITPTIVGTVQVTVNEATNETYSRTVYHSEYATNGSVSLITRTDTNSLGTVTAAVNDINGGYATL